MSSSQGEVEAEEDFTILPNFLDQNGASKKRKDLYRLPEWMSSFAKRFNSGEITSSTSIGIDQLDYLDEEIRSILLSDLKIEHLFPVQAQVIPYLISQRQTHSPLPSADVCVASPTGSGKTLTYVVPLIQNIRHRLARAVRIVILLPVQDLAEQVHHVVEQFCKKLRLISVLLAGQQSFEDEQKILVERTFNGDYRSSVDVIVCTPGRLVEHLSRTEGFRLDQLEYLVIDEADRIIEEFKHDWLTLLDRSVDKSNQQKENFQSFMLECPTHRTYTKLLFSATLTHNPEIIQQLNLFRPVLFSSSASSIVMPKTLKEQFVVCSITYKPLLVAYLIENQLKSEKILIFVHSKKDVDRLTLLLRQLLPNPRQIGQISRNFSSNKIQTRLTLFEKGQFQVLVCSDLLA